MSPAMQKMMSKYGTGLNTNSSSAPTMSLLSANAAPPTCVSKKDKPPSKSGTKNTVGTHQNILDGDCQREKEETTKCSGSSQTPPRSSRARRSWVEVKRRSL